MKQLIPILLIFLLACSRGEQNQKEQSQQKTDSTSVHDSGKITDSTLVKPKDTVKVIKNVVPSGNELVDRIGEIKHVPYVTIRYLGRKNRIRELHCGDAFFWQLVQMGKKAIPHLITKVLDSTQTNIKIPCSETYLNVGTVAYIVLNYIIRTPPFLVFKMQFDSITINCNFGFADNELIYINNFPKKVHLKLAEWYKKYRSKVKIIFDDQPNCKKQYNLDSVWRVRYF